MLSADTTRFISTMSGDFFVEFRSVVRGYHVYRSVWTPVLGELLYTEQELGNPEDRYAVSVLKSSTIVGHIPREISKLCWMFMNRSGEIQCTVTGARQRSYLVQGGLEIPCIYRFSGKKKLVDKLTSLMQEMKYEVVSSNE